MYDALIILNGEIPDQKYWQDIRYRTLICTDGAALTLLNFALTPDIIIGDMDSISDSTSNATINSLQERFPQSAIHQIIDQEHTDFEKALQFAYSQKINKVLCLGALGKSADHSVHNLQVAIRFSHQLSIMLLHAFETSRQWIFPLSNSGSRIYTIPGAIISFIPFPEAKITTQGLKWELNEGLLSQTGRSGVRNVVVADQVIINSEGQCMCFIISDKPPVIEVIG